MHNCNLYSLIDLRINNFLSIIYSLILIHSLVHSLAHVIKPAIALFFFITITWIPKSLIQSFKHSLIHFINHLLYHSNHSFPNLVTNQTTIYIAWWVTIWRRWTTNSPLRRIPSSTSGRRQPVRQAVSQAARQAVRQPGSQAARQAGSQSGSQSKNYVYVYVMVSPRTVPNRILFCLLIIVMLYLLTITWAFLTNVFLHCLGIFFLLLFPSFVSFKYFPLFFLIS